MRMYDLIEKKRNGGELSEKELRWMVQGFTKEEIPDYQMAAFFMAVYFKGMTERETWILTDAVAKSGDVVDLSAIPGKKVDKHSTGGVGDKTTLTAGPMAAAAGVKVAKMSGRGLGHTGGTVDKLESIPGFQTVLSQERFLEVVRETGISVIGQSGNLAPADKKMYALRDVTATVESIPLIAASVMGKKLAAGSDCILLDVKVGSGAFMKTKEDALSLAKTMVNIGMQAKKPTAALITNMDLPLGHAIGNTLEVKEAVLTLKGQGPEDLTELSVELAANMIFLSGQGSLSECRKKARETIENGSALNRLCAMIKAQGGEESMIREPDKLPEANIQYEIKAEREGYLSHMDTEGVGLSSALLGAGRETLTSPVDSTAGIFLLKKTGDRVRENETLAIFHTSDKERIPDAKERFLRALTFSEERKAPGKLILDRVE